MFGIHDPGIWLAYLLALASLAYSIVFGIVMWNKDEDTPPMRDADSIHSKNPGR